MRLPLLFAVSLGALALVAAAVLLLGLHLDLDRSAAGFWGLAALLLATVGAWLLLMRLVAKPLTRLSEKARGLAETAQSPAIDPRGAGPLAEHWNAVAALGAALAEARSQSATAVAEALSREALETNRLGAVLRDLGEGVLVCSLDHRILLYNAAAARALGAPPQLGLGRPLFDLLTREPVLHALERLDSPAEETRAGENVVGFVGATAGGSALLEGRMTLIRDEAEQALGYVLSFENTAARVAQIAERERLLQAAIQGTRGPLGALRAAAEALQADPDLPSEKRAAFDSVIRQESLALSEWLEALSRAHERLDPGSAPDQRIHSSDLLAFVGRAAREQQHLELTPVGLPLWLQGDSHAMLLVLQELLRRLQEECGASQFDAEALLSDRRAYLELRWQGAFLPEQRLTALLDRPLRGRAGGGTLRDALESLAGAALWSRRLPEGRAALRLPIAAACPPPAREAAERGLPARPEFYDFDLLGRANRAARQDERPLREVDFVVFDTETTGLRPSEGDEAVSLGAVRIVNGRLLSGEVFDQLIDPGRPIPARSSRFHGITDAQVEGKPSLVEILPRFRAFVGDAVLVGHNVAFDLKFLQMKEGQAGVVFDNGVLDTLLLSRFIEPEAADHSLDAVAQRLGLPVERRHTALGDALLTAAILLRQMERLEARGIGSLAEAVQRSDTRGEVKRLQAQF